MARYFHGCTITYFFNISKLNCSRADGAPKQARTSPGRNSREGSRRCPMRHAADGVQSGSRDKFRVPAQRGVRGCRGESVSFEKGNTLTAAGADVRAQAQGKTAFFPQCAGSAPSDQGARFSPLTPCPAPGRRPAAHAGQQPQWTEGHRLNTSGTSYLFKVEML